MTSRSLLVFFVALLGVLSLGCPGGQPKPDGGAGGSTYVLGGTVSGLVGSGLVLENAGEDPLGVTEDGSFEFPTRLAEGTAYAVAVRTQPTSPKQTCVIENGSDTMGSGDVTTVLVQCTTDTFTIGGLVTGLSGSGLVLQNNGGDDLAVSASGAFTFATKVASAAAFAVTVKTQPASPAQACTVTGGTGTIVAGNVTSIAVNCVTNARTVGGTVSGLAGTLVLQNNAGDDLTINSNGSYAFATPLTAGESYAVTVLTQPATPSQTCNVANGTGTMGTANVTNVAITCTTNSFDVGGTINGLVGTVVLRNNGGDNLSRNVTGPFTFATKVTSGQSYAVTVFTQPAGQTCTVTAGSGTVTSAAISNVEVNCVTKTFNVGGTIAGLTGTLVLRNNGGDDLTKTADGAYTFATKVAFGQPYAVTVQTEPAGLSCLVTNGSGTMGAADVTDANVSCALKQYTIGGTVTGLTGTVVLQNNGGNDLSLSASGDFTFTNTATMSQVYAVTVLTQPSGQTCLVTNDTGTVGTTDVTNVTVTCAALTYPVGGTVTGISGTLVLQNNGGDDLTLTADGTFQFATGLVNGTAYAVTVLTQPTNPCTVVNGDGTMGTSEVTTIVVNCVPNAYVIGGTVSGLDAGVVLQNNGGNDLTVAADGPFAFTTPIATSAGYAVTVLTAPSTLDCLVANGSGTVGSANVSDVAVTCATKTFDLGGSVTGLTGTLILQNNGADDLTVSGDGSFTFATKVTLGQPYAVTVGTQPSTQLCTIANGSGTMSAAVSDVAVTCVNKYKVGGTVTGLTGTLVLRNNGGDDESIPGDGAFEFATEVASGAAYAVTVHSQPGGLACTIANGSGTMGSAPVTNVTVTCAPAATTVMVVRVGAGTASLNSASTAVFLEERNLSDGAVVQTFPMPTAASGAQQAFTLAGSATSEGGLSLSSDRKFLALAGYSAIPGVATIAGTSASSTPRIAARVSSAGAIDTSTVLTGVFSAGNPRAAATVDGSAFWVVGASSGVQYAALGSTTPTTVSTSQTNLRGAHVFSGQLYVTSGAGGFTSVAQVGTGTPTTTGQTTSVLSGLPTTGASPYSFAVMDLDSGVAGVDTIYLALDSNPAGADKLNVQKWKLVSTTWTQQTFTPALTGASSVGARGLAAYDTGSGVQIVATTNETLSRLVTFVDTGTASPAVTVLATAPANTAYRGVAFSPIP